MEEAEKACGGPFDGSEGLDSITLAWAIGKIRALIDEKGEGK